MVGITPPLRYNTHRQLGDRSFDSLFNCQMNTYQKVEYSCKHSRCK